MERGLDSPRVAAVCGLAASALAFAVPLLGAWARPGYDSVAQYVSELGEHGAADGALVSLGGFLPIGLLGLAFLGLGARALAVDSRARAATVLFAAVPLGYLVAAFACVGLIGHYLVHVLGGWLRGVGFAAMLGTLYAALYGLLISEDDALVLGAGLLFLVLTSIMVLTRRVDWYRTTATS